VVVHQGQAKGNGPGGKTVSLTHAAGATPLPPFDDDDARSLTENCCSKEAKH
jgi:hypothetical protein